MMDTQAGIQGKTQNLQNVIGQIAFELPGSDPSPSHLNNLRRELKNALSSCACALPEQVLGELGPKEPVLIYLVVIHTKRKLYQKQSVDVLREFLQSSSWLEALRCEFQTNVSFAECVSKSHDLQEVFDMAEQNFRSIEVHAGATELDIQVRHASLTTTGPVTEVATSPVAVAIAAPVAANVTSLVEAPSAAPAEAIVVDAGTAFDVIVATDPGGRLAVIEVPPFSPPHRLSEPVSAIGPAAQQAEQVTVQQATEHYDRFRAPSVSAVLQAYKSCRAESERLEEQRSAQRDLMVPLSSSVDTLTAELEDAWRQMQALNFSVGENLDAAVGAFEAFRLAVARSMQHARPATRDAGYLIDDVVAKERILAFLVELRGRRKMYVKRINGLLSSLGASEAWRQVAVECDNDPSGELMTHMAPVLAAMPGNQIIIIPEPSHAVDAIKAEPQAEPEPSPSLPEPRREEDCDNVRLFVRILSASNLGKRPFDGTNPDPYVQVKVGCRARRTASVFGNCNPCWLGDCLDFVLSPSLDVQVQFEIRDCDRILGSVGLDLGSAPFGTFERERHAYRLEKPGQPAGELEFEWAFVEEGGFPKECVAVSMAPEVKDHDWDGAVSTFTASWMYADTASSIARLNPVRWSGAVCEKTLLRELEERSGKNRDRPVLIRFNPNRSTYDRCGSVDEVRALFDKRRQLLLEAERQGKIAAFPAARRATSFLWRNAIDVT